MDLLRFLVVFLLVSSCAKVGYIINQAPGQLSLIYGAKDNEKILNDPEISEENKNKIRLIKKYKAYFYEFFGTDPGRIYTKTTILDREAVSYLVIASKYDRIEAKTDCFPFVGCFPYIGFFDIEDAKEHAQDLRDENYHTWVRPVYAYSSLNYFTDPIISSFFKYSDIQLAELIFHELFHSIFFVKDEVDLNENLANYFSKKMTYIYFNYKKGKVKEVEQFRKRGRELSQTISKLAKELKELYCPHDGMQPKEAADMLAEFLKNRFNPAIRKKCNQIGYEKCLPLKREWNNASFAALLTYEKESFLLEKLHNSGDRSLKEFYVYVQKQYKEYEDGEKKGSFRDHLLKK